MSWRLQTWATTPSVLSNNKDNKSSDKKWQGLVSSEKDVSRGQFGFFIYFYSLAVIHDPKGNWNTNCDVVEVHGVFFFCVNKTHPLELLQRMSKNSSHSQSSFGGYCAFFLFDFTARKEGRKEFPLPPPPPPEKKLWTSSANKHCRLQ